MVGDSSDGVSTAALSPSDAEILSLFRREPQQAWELFIGRYADGIFSHLRHMGFDYDEAMDRFVYVCEKLYEQDFRRLKTVRYAGSHGDLTPWLRAVVRRLATNWLWSVEGRKRLLKPITRLPGREQRIFELYFWKGLAPSAIHEQLRLEHHDIRLIEVLNALETIFSLLSRKKLWRLMSNLARTRGEVSLDERDEETGTSLQPIDARADPEEELIGKETEQRLNRALDGLLTEERLLVQFRYEEGMQLKEIAEMLHIKEKDAKKSLRAALNKLQRALK